MRRQLGALTAGVFGVLMMVAILIGAVVAVMFIVGFIAGGSLGQSASVWGDKLMAYGIQIAALGVLFGLINFYAFGQHQLTLAGEKQGEKGQKLST